MTKNGRLTLPPRPTPCSGSSGLNAGAGVAGERWISVAAVCHEDDQPTGSSSGIGSPNGRIGIGRPL